tara:strand:+ start:1023 stop:1811 length:789 start_codon:yes stop_codon:yes gene_type:complete
MTSISVVITTVKSPDALDLCIRSALEGQENDNQIIVVCDGYYDDSKHVLEKYAEKINLVRINNNVGMCKAQNFGVYSCTNDNILIVHDDHVFPKGWDTTLSKIDISDAVVSPNQIEPYDSMYPQFVIADLGRDPKTFDLEKFWQYESKARHSLTEISGCTYPIYIKKINYNRVGGFDTDYPDNSGLVADWDFFLKCELNNLKMVRTYQPMFYHFVSLTQKKTPEEEKKSSMAEQACHGYFRFKWGQAAQHNPQNNSKLLKGL